MTAHAPELPDLSGLKPTARHLAELAAELGWRITRTGSRSREHAEMSELLRTTEQRLAVAESKAGEFDALADIISSYRTDKTGGN